MARQLGLSPKLARRRYTGPLIRRILPRAITKRLYRQMALRYINSIDVPLVQDRKTILVLNHFYDQDIRALIRANKDYNLVAIDAPTLFKGAKIFFREDIQALNAPYKDEHLRNLQEYRQECTILFEALRKKFGVDLLVTASDIFYWVRELIGVARERGVKTVVLDKEGLISPSSFDAAAKRIRAFAPFISDHIFVWSERQRSFWQKIGVAAEDISVIGQARSDLFYQEMNFVVDAYFPEKRPIITFFTYEDTAYIPLDLVANEGLSWKEMKTMTQDLILSVAEAHPDYNFVFKAHPQQSDLKDLQERYERPNLRVIGGAAIANELVVRSDLIIAFQTTAVLEAMFMNRRVVYTAWDPLTERLKDQILPFQDAPGIVVARSFDYFSTTLDRFLNRNFTDFQFSPEEEALKHQMVSKYFFQADGHVSERFLTAAGRFMA